MHLPCLRSKTICFLPWLKYAAHTMRSLVLLDKTGMTKNWLLVTSIFDSRSRRVECMLKIDYSFTGKWFKRLILSDRQCQSLEQNDILRIISQLTGLGATKICCSKIIKNMFWIFFEDFSLGPKLCFQPIYHMNIIELGHWNFHITILKLIFGENFLSDSYKVSV